jgi:hypothetical protein
MPIRIGPNNSYNAKAFHYPQLRAASSGEGFVTRSLPASMDQTKAQSAEKPAVAGFS